MKRLHFYLLSFLLLLVAVMLPEVQQVLSIDAVGDGVTLAAGAAFAPLKWPMGQNNMGGFKSIY